MILSPKEIQELLKKTFPKIRFLETVSATTGRFRSKSIIVFEYTNIAGEDLVLKFFSLQKLEEDAKALEKADLLDEFRRIKSFGNHPNLVKVYDANELWKDGQLIGFYITMEKFNHTLSSLIRREYRFSEEEVRSFLEQMDSILYHAHYKLTDPIVHSDIKPDNIGIRVLKDGSYEYALMDFDISSTLERQAASKEMSFTLSNKALMRGVSPAYAPPEQVMAYIHKSGNISNRVDVYAVGAVAMEMMTGHKPRKEEDQMYYDLPFHKIRGTWKAIFERMCHRDPKKRAKRVADALNIEEGKENEESPVVTFEAEPISFKVEQGPFNPEAEPSDFNVNSGLNETYEEEYFEDELNEESNTNKIIATAVVLLLIMAGGFYYWSTLEKDDIDHIAATDPPAQTTPVIRDPRPGDQQPYTEIFAIGDIGPAGGLVFFDKGFFRDGWRYLEAAPGGWFDEGDDPRKSWGCRGENIRATGREIGFGLANTIAVFENCSEDGIAAQVVMNLSLRYQGEIFDDWFIPSREELNLLYRNLHQQDLGGFSSSLYWSSTQINSGLAWVQNFSNGSQRTDFKSDERRIRPIRAF